MSSRWREGRMRDVIGDTIRTTMMEVMWRRRRKRMKGDVGKRWQVLWEGGRYCGGEGREINFPDFVVVPPTCVCCSLLQEVNLPSLLQWEVNPPPGLPSSPASSSSLGSALAPTAGKGERRGRKEEGGVSLGVINPSSSRNKKESSGQMQRKEEEQKIMLF